MDPAVGSPGVQLLNRYAEVIDEWLIGEFYLTGWVHGTYQPRNAINNLTEVGFTRSQLFQRNWRNRPGHFRSLRKTLLEQGS
jgi:hypothetical protein